MIDNKTYFKLIKARKQVKRIELVDCFNSSLIDKYREKVERLERKLNIKAVLPLWYA